MSFLAVFASSCVCCCCLTDNFEIYMLTSTDLHSIYFFFPCHRSGVRPVGATTAETKMGSKNTQLNSINNMAVREIIYTYIHIVYAAWNLLSWPET